MKMFPHDIAIEEDGDVPITKITHCNQFDCMDKKTYKYPKLIKEQRGNTIFHMCPSCRGSFGSWPIK